jgi:iron-sulfur cluster assembly protein
MIKLTKNAGDKVRQIIESKEKKPIGLQAGVKGGGCSGFTYYLDFIYEKDVKDRELESEGVKIYIDSKSYLYLIGTEIDYLDGLSGKGFKFVNPNAKRTCGCGESFSV